jgi:hypothetical protein
MAVKPKITGDGAKFVGEPDYLQGMALADQAAGGREEMRVER